MINKLNRLRIYSLLITIIFFISSCITPSITTDNSEQSKDRKGIFVNGKKTGEVIFPKSGFRIKDAGVGCPQAGFEIFSVGNCNESFVLYQNNVAILTLNQPSVGQYQSYVGCDCGINYSLEFKHIINGCGISSTETVGTMNLFYPCPNSNKPTPEPSPSADCDSTNTPTILPNAFVGKGLNFSGKSFSSLNISESLKELTSKINEIKKLQSEYDNLNARGDISKRDEINTQLQNAIIQRDSIKQDIIIGLNSYKVDLRNKVNNLLQENFSIDDTTLITDTAGYKAKIDDLESDFSYYVSSGNTYNLAYSLSTLADESKVLADMVNDYANNTLTELAPVVNPEYPSELEYLTKPEDLIKYLSKSIDYNRILFDTELLKLSENFSQALIDKEIYETALLLHSYYLSYPAPNGFNIQSYSDKPFSVKLDKGVLIDKIDKAEKFLEKAVKKTKNPTLALGVAALVIHGRNLVQIYNNLPLSNETLEQSQTRIKAEKDDLDKIKQQKIEKQNKENDERIKDECKKDEPIPENLKLSNKAGCNGETTLNTLKDKIAGSLTSDKDFNVLRIRIPNNLPLQPPKTFFSHTGFTDPGGNNYPSSDDFPIRGLKPNINDNLFKCLGNGKENDAETKALAYLDWLLKQFDLSQLPTSPRVEIIMDSLIKPCGSCDTALKRFAKKYPNVKLKVKFCKFSNKKS